MVQTVKLAATAGRSLEVRDLMTANVMSVRPSATLESVYDLMDSCHIRHVPVVDADGNLEGLLTQRNLTDSLLDPRGEIPVSVRRDNLRSHRVREVMETDVETVEPEADLRDAAGLLLEEKLGCLPVVEGTHLVGILTEADFVRFFADRAVV